MVYSANGRPIRIRMDRLAAGPIDAFWFDPRTGQRRRAAAVPSDSRAPVHEFAPPGGVRDGNDWVLILAAESR